MRSHPAIHHEKWTSETRSKLDFRTGRSKCSHRNVSAAIAESQRPFKIQTLIKPHFYRAFIQEALRFGIADFGREFNSQAGDNKICWKHNLVTRRTPEDIACDIGGSIKPSSSYCISSSLDIWRANRSSQSAKKVSPVHSLQIIPGVA